MLQPIFYTPGGTAALCHAKNRLQEWGYTVSPIPSQHVTHLLLGVPGFEESGRLKGGQRLEDVLRHLPENITVFGGRLPEALPYRRVDFLLDEFYLAENAHITAQCAVKRLQRQCRLEDAAILIIGWGRIGKQLLPLLKSRGAAVTVAVRTSRQADALERAGESAVLTSQWQPQRYDIIINTAPAPVLQQAQTRSGAVLMDLASVQGILGEDVQWLRGLPNRDAPEDSGGLIAKTALRFALGKETL